MSHDTEILEHVGFWKHLRRTLRGNSISMAAIGYLVILVAMTTFLPLFSPHDPLATNLEVSFAPPSATYWFGTDEVGRDVFSRVVSAARLDLAIAISSVLLSFVIGTFIGSFASFFGGIFDNIAGRVTDVLMTFPLFVIAMALVAAMGNSVESIVVASSVVNLPFFIRLSRVEVARLRAQPFVEAARAGGNSDMSILIRFMIPNAIPTLMVQVSTGLGWAILNIASLSFIGLGIHPPTPEWGIMVAEGAEAVMAGNWWLVAFPGLALTLTVLSFNLLGDSMRDIMDVRFRR